MIRSPPRGPLLLTAALLLLASVPSSLADASVNSPSKKPNSPPSHTPVGKPPSSVAFRLIGNVHPAGEYYVEMRIGDPPMPYYLDMDTGSDVTWIQCDPPEAPCVKCFKGTHPHYRPKEKSFVPCNDPLCAAVKDSTGQGSSRKQCKSPNRCDYKIEYADGLSSLGYLVVDAAELRPANGPPVRPKLPIGCGYEQQNEDPNAKKDSPTDGMMGLGSGRISIISQLKEQGITQNVIGHCLGRSGGYLFFGNDRVPSSGVTWARNVDEKYYSPGKASYSYGKQSLGVRKELVVFDSGSTVTYFTNRLYQDLLDTLKNDLKNKPLKEVEEQDNTICWRGTKKFASPADLKNFFQSMVLNFGTAKNAAQLVIPPENYLIITEEGNACLGIFNGDEAGVKDLNIIGDVSMQDLMVVYDNERKQIGWAPMNCEQTSKVWNFTSGIY